MTAPIDNVLSRLDAVKPTGDGKWQARCPGHDDRNPSLSVGIGDEGRVLLHCHGPCERGDVLAALGLTDADLFERRNGDGKPEIVAEYDYTDEDGHLLFQVVRLSPKSFRQRKPDGNGGWEWKLGSTRRVLYRLPEVRKAAEAGGKVCVVEGEKDVHALEERGIVATTCAGGAGKWRGEYSESLCGAQVGIVADADEPGRKHAAEVAASLEGVAASVRVLEPAEGCKDVSDHLAAGHSLSELVPVEIAVPDGDALSESAARPGTSDEEGETGLGAIPPYPADALPAAARELVGVGERAGLPAALLGGAVLGALAAAIGPEAQVEVTGPTWRERAILWPVLLGPRGAGKSPAQDLALGPLRDHDAQLDPEDEDARPPILYGDLTFEALVRELAEGGGAGAVDVDELAQLLRGLGEYKRGGGGDRGRLLAAWSGAPISFRRVGGAGKAGNAIKINIARPTLAIVGGLQPALHELLGGEEDGLRPRWLPHLAAMPETADLAAAERPLAWQLLLGGELIPARSEPRTWRLGEGALARFQTHRNRWKAQARALETASTAAALVKADVHLARVALVFAEAESPTAGGEIAGDLVDRAAAIVEFALGCWRALPEQDGLALSRRDATLDRSIVRLIAWLEEHGGEASRRELQRAHVAGVRTAGDLDALLDRYEATYPGTVTEARQPHGRGLPTVVVKAPRRRAFTQVSPPGDTKVSNGDSPHGKAENVDVASGDTLSGDTLSGDSSPAGAATSEEQAEIDRIAGKFGEVA